MDEWGGYISYHELIEVVLVYFCRNGLGSTNDSV